MSNLFRMASVAAAAAAALAATPAQAVPSSNGDATARARILKPLQLTHVIGYDFNLGDITLSGAGPFSATVILAQNGTLTCPAAVTCTGTRSVARYNVAGTQGQRVLINVPSVLLENAAGDDLWLTPLAPAFVDLSNSGAPGNDFDIGGQITVSDTTPDGVYTGVFAVTANYQ